MLFERGGVLPAFEVRGIDQQPDMALLLHDGLDLRGQCREVVGGPNFSGAMIFSTPGAITSVLIIEALPIDRGDVARRPAYALKGTSFAGETRPSPLAPAGFPAFSRRSRNGLIMSIGIGKMMVEFCSAPISVRVCR